jgi:NAD(P)-dependent dehydrogenase (short-subunit alcohol dehydrogenase family)
MLDGKHAVVTGASRGIGAAIAAALAAEGVRVSRMSRSAGIRMDVTQPDTVEAAFAAARQQHGPIAILVNNAGSVESMPYLKITDQDWRNTLAIDLDSVHYCTRRALPDMVAAGWGRIVNIASIAALRGFSYAAAYIAAKHGVLGLTRALSEEFARKGVTVNAICPGYTDTDIVRNAAETIVRKTGRTEAEALAALAQGNASGRLIQPEEVAREVVRLCRPESDSVNGQALTVE